MPGPKYTEDTLNRAAEMREAGMKYVDIAAELGMTPSSVYGHCLKLGAYSPQTVVKTPDTIGTMVVKRGNHMLRRFTPEEDAVLMKMDMDGARIVDMAKATGRKSNSVRGRLMTLARRDELAMGAS